MRTFLFLAFLFFFQNSFGQKTKVIFLDENENITKEWGAEYYREVTQNSEGNYNVEGFFMSGKRQMTGQYLTKKLVNEIGSFEYYDEQGNLETVEFYADGKLEGIRTSYYPSGKTKVFENYENGQRHGEYREYYEDSTMRAEATFVHGNIQGSAHRYSKSGKRLLEMNIDTSGNGSMQSFYLNGDLYQNGQFEKYRCVGTWNSYNRGNEIAKTDEYSKTNETGSSSNTYRRSLHTNFYFFKTHDFEILEIEGVVHYPDKEAEFPQGQMTLQKYIVSNIKYPEEAINKGVQGKAYLYFVVEIDGSISNVTVAKSPRLLKEESIRIVEGMPNWQPGEYKKEKVRTICRLPIVYTLN